MLTDTKISTRPLASGFGAEIIGVDLSRPIDAATEQAIRDAWIEHGILLFRGADQDDEAQMRLSRIFGDMEPAATADMNDPNNQYMMTLAYDPDDKAPRFQQHYNVGGIDRAGWLGWHWDQSFMPTIVRGAVLRMEMPSPEMGETGFIDAVGAWNRLPDDLKARIEGLEVVYLFNPDFVSGQYGFPEDIKALPREKPAKEPSYDFPPVVHPMVITQVETGRKVLKLSPMHARYILGMDADESDALLKEVASYLVDPAFAYFHDWQKNDMVVWDNWRVIHGANGVPLHCKRRARRTTIMGDYKVGRYLDPALDRDRKVKRLVD
ncbi:TauD/TfdA dioxygenase family protein [Rhizorhabdus dicambivorans]|uniref:TauD/TfdA family dioxygenase n=1 Tax=Rhizorhabdus dicambivorans TaxID=1850238 RepID=A0A2A4FRU4_9SPHN|nr:TauD/TfdA family dioxygenase [Rhizorhabdus dicambivorans]ATE63968.1 TauD/TfdA family dioxygenase [Rhizorhabdus dicambivorans]PCE40168.1 TauD/TfdA family dioxygenase [Rhizorhabdus dicambivorans]